ncbi:MAG: hypothetical protein OQK12_13155 [Motiliproteus sp.]|nr:hypothetical protein [Motiliproteus sp.]MCW9051774.1 hypothetical protein [Motiliproteus sp.]
MHSIASPASSSESVKQSVSGLLNRWWNRLAYQHRAAESSLHLLFVSGFPLWSVFSISWDLERTLLLAHSLMGLVLFPLYVLPFWISHRRLIQKSRKALLRKTGRALDLLLLLCGLSGAYLILNGNRGDLLGWIIHYLHLVTSIPLTLLLIRHALRWSVLSWLFKPFTGIRH